MPRTGGAALVVFLVGALLTAPACAAAGRVAAAPAATAPTPAATNSPAATPAASPANPWLDPAREVLVQHCGRCHRGDLPTSLPKALAVFDLARPAWNERLVAPQYDSLLTRVREAQSIEPDEREAVEAFVRCARDGACGAS